MKKTLITSAVLFIVLATAAVLAQEAPTAAQPDDASLRTDRLPLRSVFDYGPRQLNALAFRRDAFEHLGTFF